MTIAASAASDARNQLRLAGKRNELVILGDAPLVAETPTALLDDMTTPIESFFVRNNGAFPTDLDPATWVLTIDGEVERPLELTLADLRSIGRTVSRWLVLECGGNGRAAFSPPAKGNQWTQGGVGCAEWTGVALRDVLSAAGLRPTATYTAHHGSDGAISRGIRLDKALEPSTLLVWGMNGEPLPEIHGGPLRLIVPGWPGSASQKWLTRITIRDREHDGAGMTGFSYRVPTRPLRPGEEPDPADFRILESMPVRAIITSPADSDRLAAGTPLLAVRGAAWAGDLDVRAVDVSIDGGAGWTPASLAEPRNRYDWRRWSADIPISGDGSIAILARATDSEGRVQPFEPELWNANGYGGNAMHRVTVRIG
ncbi:MAG TPA: sulfite oxidase [Candidatus Limnocylindria bacterium]|nr:sulfite oxidase [Candidatus Limnocylindria bacterium]